MVTLNGLLPCLIYFVLIGNSDLLNQYESDGINYWASLSTFIPIQNATYGKIQIKNKMFFQWDLFWYDIVANGTDYENIFRIGNHGYDTISCDQHAHRYPGLYINTITKKLQIAVSDTTDCFGTHYQEIDFTLTPHTKYSFTMQYTQETLVIVCNDKPIYTGNRLGVTPNDTLYSFVDVIISDPLNTAANCTIDDLLIVSYEHRLSKYPTESPTFSPTSIPTVSPSILTTDPPSNNPTTLPSSIPPTLSPTYNPTLQSITTSLIISELYTVDSTINIIFNGTLVEIEKEGIAEIKDTIKTLIMDNVDSIDGFNLVLFHQLRESLSININYETYDESEANALELYITTNLAEDLKYELGQKYKDNDNDERRIITIITETSTVTIIDDVDTIQNEDEDEQDIEEIDMEQTASNDKILWLFTEKTIWYLIVAVFIVLIIVVMGCCCLYYRYRVLLQKSKYSRSKVTDANFREREMSPPPQIVAVPSNNNNVSSSGIKYHYNKNGGIGYAFKDKKSPSMHTDNDEDICLVPQQFDIGSDNATQSVSSTIVSPQLSAKVSIASVSDLTSVATSNDINSRKSIKIVHPQYYNPDNNDNELNNVNNNSDSNESMYDETLSNSKIETTACDDTDDGNTK